MTLAICPGSFDPVTCGHLDVIARAASFASKVVVVIGVNRAKSGLFTPAQRAELLRGCLDDVGLEKVEVVIARGLLAHTVTELGATMIVKGLRNGADLEAENPQAWVNLQLTGVQTVFLPANSALSQVSSSLVKELASYGALPEGIVPARVRAALDATLKGK